ncbi:MAG: multidrug transporter [Cyanobacteria bacterium P01_F01_bin.86]
MKHNDSGSLPSPPSDSQSSLNTKDPSLAAQPTDDCREEAIASSPQGLKRQVVWPIAALVAIAALVMVGFRVYQSLRPEAAVSEVASEPARIPVRVTRAAVGLAQQWVFDEGVVAAVRRRVLKFEDNGNIEFIAKVEGRDLREGDTVAQGELLATIDDRTQIVAIETAEADLEVSIQSHNQAESALLQAQANFDKAQSDLNLAETELVRYQSLYEGGAVAATDLDVEANDADQARAALRVAEQDIRAAEDDVRAASAQIEASQARLREAQVDLEDTQLVSPIDGVVAYINIREGEYWDTQRINSNDLDNVAETAPIVIVEPQSLEVELELQADEAQAIRPGQQAYAVLEEDVSTAEAAGVSNNNLLAIAQAEGSQGRVFAVSPTQTPGGRGVEVSIRDFQLVRSLQVGGRVYIWIEAANNPNAVMIPLGLIQPGEAGPYAFVVDEATGTVERRQLEVGIEGLNGIEILSGIESGDLVVTDGINRLVDGMQIEVVSEEASL